MIVWILLCCSQECCVSTFFSSHLAHILAKTVLCAFLAIMRIRVERNISCLGFWLLFRSCILQNSCNPLATGIQFWKLFNQRREDFLTFASCRSSLAFPWIKNLFNKITHIVSRLNIQRKIRVSLLISHAYLNSHGKFPWSVALYYPHFRCLVQESCYSIPISIAAGTTWLWHDGPFIE